MKEHKVGILGVGFVGTAVSVGLGSVAEIREYDKYKATESLDSVVNESDILFVCLPTPMKSDGECDISIVEDVLVKVERCTLSSKVIVIKSTVPPGTTERLASRHAKHTFVFNPEFLTERNFINDFLNQRKIILGTVRGKNFPTCMPGSTINELVRLYTDFAKTQKNPAGIFEIDSKEAEMLKYATNCFLAMKVAYFNEIYDICESNNIEFDAVTGIMRLDKRIGTTHMQVPGLDFKRGFSGSCFPKDLCSLIFMANKEIKHNFPIIKAIWESNLQRRKDHDWEKLPQVNGKYEKEV